MNRTKEDLDPTKHNYYRKVMDLLASNPDLQTAGLHDIDIRHDAWCAIHQGRYCNCDPDVRVRGKKRV
jgi:hypothetical protein